MKKVLCTEVKLPLNSNGSRSWKTTQLWGNSVDVKRHNEEESVGLDRLFDILATTFLPVGYPHTVRKEYLTYQIWDSIQGMSSYLRSVLTTRSVLAGAGVGSAESTALAAALTWVFRDGFGMIGSLVFAYGFSDTFEVYIKEWRYLADILNNIGLTLDLLSADFPQYYFTMTSISTLCKSCCGLIAGATKARISAHFAKPGHLADVTAKESTQETAVALCGLVIGMVLAQMIGNDDLSVWITFTVLLLIHQYSNYHLVKVLVFFNLNPQRCKILVEHTARVFEYQCNQINDDNKNDSKNNDKNDNKVKLEKLCIPPPSEVAKKEGCLMPIYLSALGPVIGGSIHEIIHTVQFIVVNRSGSFGPPDGVPVEVEGRHRRSLSLPPQDNQNKSKDGLRFWSMMNVSAVFAKLCEVWSAEEFIIGVNMNGRLIVSLCEGICSESVVKAYMIAYYMHRRLQANIALFIASRESKHAYLSEMYHFLLAILVPEALCWYKFLDFRHTDGEDMWRWGDLTALTTGLYRYEDINMKDE